MAKKRQDKPKERQPNPRKCEGTRKDGGPCGAMPLKSGTVMEGVTVSGRWCMAHDEDIPRSATIQERGRAGGHKGGRPKNPTIPSVMKQVIEENIEHMLTPYAAAVGLKVERRKVDGAERLVMVKDPSSKGATLYGESKDGEIVMTDYPDLEAQQKAAERMLDRVYGRPKQATELSFGGDGDAELPEVPASDERALEVALILKQTGGVTTPTLNVKTNGNDSTNGTQ